MKLSLLILLLLLPSLAFAAVENGYQAILDLDQDQLKEQSIKKGDEFIQSTEVKESADLDYRFVNIRNEFHESIKIAFEDSQGKNIKELYLNAYENLDKVALPKDSDLKVHVINVHGQVLGTLRTSIENKKKINISPFMLIKKYNFKQPKIEVMEQHKAELILKQEPNRPEIQTQKLQEQKIESENIDRSIKVANISKTKVHIDIIEPEAKSIGAGWTIQNDIYEAQFLEYKTKPVKISSKAKLILEINGKERLRKEAAELALDPRGNYIWFITDPL